MKMDSVLWSNVLNCISALLLLLCLAGIILRNFFGAFKQKGGRTRRRRRPFSAQDPLESIVSPQAMAEGRKGSRGEVEGSQLGQSGDRHFRRDFRDSVRRLLCENLACGVCEKAARQAEKVVLATWFPESRQLSLPATSCLPTVEEVRDPEMIPPRTRGVTPKGEPESHQGPEAPPSLAKREEPTSYEEQQGGKQSFAAQAVQTVGTCEEGSGNPLGQADCSEKECSHSSADSGAQKENSPSSSPPQSGAALTTWTPRNSSRLPESSDCSQKNLTTSSHPEGSHENGRELSAETQEDGMRVLSQQRWNPLKSSPKASSVQKAQPLLTPHGTHNSFPTGFLAADTPLVADEARATLEWHLAVKRVQHEMGLPSILLRSLRAFSPLAPGPSCQWPPRRDSVVVETRPRALPFMSGATRRKLEQHVKKMVHLKRWELPGRVQRALRHLQPDSPCVSTDSSSSAPREDSAGAKGQKTEKPDRPVLRVTALGVGRGQIKLQIHVVRKSFQVGQGKVPKVVEKSREITAPKERKLPLPKLIPRHRRCPQPRSGPCLLLRRKADCVEMNIRSKYIHFLWGLPTLYTQSLREMVPKAPVMSAAPRRARHNAIEFGHVATPFLPACEQQDLESHVLRKRVQHQWGLPRLVQQSLRQFLPPAPCAAPHPASAPSVRILPCGSIPFIALEAKRQLEEHIGSKIIERRWGLPKRVMESLRVFMPLSPPLTKKSRDSERASASLQDKRILQTLPSAEAPGLPEWQNTECSPKLKRPALQKPGILRAQKALEIHLGLDPSTSQPPQAKKCSLPKTITPGSEAQQPRPRELLFVEQEVLTRIELNIIHKDLMHKWGLPTLYQKSLSCLVPDAPSLEVSPLLVDSQGPGLDVSSTEALSIGEDTPEELEWHVRRKRMQHIWGLPSHAQRSLRSFLPAVPDLPHQQSGQVEVRVLPAELSFLQEATVQELERNVQKRLISQQWQLPRRVLQSLRMLRPEHQLESGMHRRASRAKCPKHGAKLSDRVGSAGKAHILRKLGTKALKKLETHLAKKCMEKQLGTPTVASGPSWHPTAFPLQKSLPRLILHGQNILQPRHTFCCSISTEDLGRIERAVQGSHLASLWGLGPRYVEASSGFSPSLPAQAVRPRTAVLESSEVQITFIPEPEREALELHIRKKKIQHEWTVPLLVQRSLQAFMEEAPNVPVQRKMKVHVDVIHQQEISFFTPETYRGLEHHVKKRNLQQKWGLPKRVLQSLRLLCPEMVGAGCTERGTSNLGRAIPAPEAPQLRSMLASKALEKMELHLEKKRVEVQLGVSPPLTRLSWQRTATVLRNPLPKLIPPGCSPLQPRNTFLPFVQTEDVTRMESVLQHNHLMSLWGLGRSYAEDLGAMMPKAPSQPLQAREAALALSPVQTPFLPFQKREALELHVRKKRVQHEWGLPAQVQRSLAGFLCEAPSLARLQKTVIQVETRPQELQFVPTEVCDRLEQHLQSMALHRQWGLPQKILHFLKPLCPNLGLGQTAPSYLPLPERSSTKAANLTMPRASSRALRPGEVDTECLEMETPFLPAEVREALEIHIRKKKLQHEWGVPGLIQSSLNGFIQKAPPLPSLQKTEIQVQVLLQEPQYVLQSTYNQLDFHIQQMKMQRQWRLPGRVLESLKFLCSDSRPHLTKPARSGYGKTFLCRPGAGSVSESSGFDDLDTEGDDRKGSRMKSATPQHAQVPRKLEPKMADIEQPHLPWQCTLVPSEALPVVASCGLPKMTPPESVLHLSHSFSMPSLEQMRPRGTVTAFLETSTSFLPEKDREALEVHILRKRIHHEWGFPIHVQKSLKAFVDELPLLPPRQNTNILVQVAPLELPFLPWDISHRLEFHVQKMNLQRQWGLPRRVLQSLRWLSSGLGDDAYRSETSRPKYFWRGFPGDTRTGSSIDWKRKGMVSVIRDRAPLHVVVGSRTLNKMHLHLAKKGLEVQLQVFPTVSTSSWEYASLSFEQALPKLILASQGSWQPRRDFLPFMRKEDVDQIELVVQRNHFASLWGLGMRYTEALAGMVGKSPPKSPKWREADVGFLEMETPFLQEEERDILEIHVKKKTIQHMWGSPRLVQRSLAGFMHVAPLLPTHKKLDTEIHPFLQETSFLHLDTHSHLEQHIQKIKLQRQWEMPRMVINSLKAFCPSAPVMRASISQTDEEEEQPGQKEDGLMDIISLEEKSAMQDHLNKKHSKVHRRYMEALAGMEPRSPSQFPKWRETNVVFLEVETPFLQEEDRNILETHVKKKSIQHLWGSPHLIQRSLVAFVQMAPSLPTHKKLGTEVHPFLQQMPFIPLGTQSCLEQHIQKIKLQRQWGVPGRVLNSLKAFCPSAPVMRASISQTDEEEEQPGQKEDRLMDIISLEEERAMQDHLDKKHSKIHRKYMEGVAGMEPRSPYQFPKWRETDVFSEVETSFLEEEDRNILETHVKKKSIQHLWGSPRLVQRSLVAFVQMAPSLPTHKKLDTEVHPFLQEMPFLSLGTQSLLEQHIQKIKLQRQWGVPGRVLNSLKAFCPSLSVTKAPLSQIHDREEQPAHKEDRLMDIISLEEEGAIQDHLNKKHRKIHRKYMEGVAGMEPRSPYQFPKWRETDVFSEVETPFLQEEDRNILETHVKKKSIQHLWGSPRLVQRSLVAFMHMAPSLPTHKKLDTEVHPFLQEISFLPLGTQSCLEQHIQKIKLQRQWGMPGRVLNSLKAFCPSLSVMKAPLSLSYEGEEQPGQKDDRLMDIISLVEDGAIQDHLNKKYSKNHRRYMEALAGMEPRSPSHFPKWRETDVVFFEVETPFLQEEDRNMLETHVKKKTIQHMWGSPRLVQRSLAGFMQMAPSLPTHKKLDTEVHPFLQEMPFLHLGTQSCMEHHIQKMIVQRKWGMPRRVLNSLKVFCPSAPVMRASLSRIDEGEEQPAPKKDRLMGISLEEKSAMNKKHLRIQAEVPFRLITESQPKTKDLGREQLPILIHDGQKSPPKRDASQLFPPPCAANELTQNAKHEPLPFAGGLPRKFQKPQSRMALSGQDPALSSKRTFIFQETETPFFQNEDKQKLENHLKKKRLQHQWGLPLAITRSLQAFAPSPPAPTHAPERAGQEIRIRFEKPFLLTPLIWKDLEDNVKKMIAHQQWGLPKRIRDWLRALSPAVLAGKGQEKEGFAKSMDENILTHGPGVERVLQTHTLQQEGNVSSIPKGGSSEASQGSASTADDHTFPRISKHKTLLKKISEERLDTAAQSSPKLDPLHGVVKPRTVLSGESPKAGQKVTATSVTLQAGDKMSASGEIEQVTEGVKDGRPPGVQEISLGPKAPQRDEQPTTTAGIQQHVGTESEVSKIPEEATARDKGPQLRPSEGIASESQQGMEEGSVTDGPHDTENMTMGAESSQRGRGLAIPRDSPRATEEASTAVPQAETAQSTEEATTAGISPQDAKKAQAASETSEVARDSYLPPEIPQAAQAKVEPERSFLSKEGSVANENLLPVENTGETPPPMEDESMVRESPQTADGLSVATKGTLTEKQPLATEREKYVPDRPPATGEVRTSAPRDAEEVSTASEIQPAAEELKSMGPHSRPVTGRETPLAGVAKKLRTDSSQSREEKSRVPESPGLTKKRAVVGKIPQRYPPVYRTELWIKMGRGGKISSVALEKSSFVLSSKPQPSEVIQEQEGSQELKPEGNMIRSPYSEGSAWKNKPTVRSNVHMHWQNAMPEQDWGFPDVAPELRHRPRSQHPAQFRKCTCGSSPESDQISSRPKLSYPDTSDTPTVNASILPQLDGSIQQMEPAVHPEISHSICTPCKCHTETYLRDTTSSYETYVGQRSQQQGYPPPLAKEDDETQNSDLSSGESTKDASLLCQEVTQENLHKQVENLLKRKLEAVHLLDTDVSQKSLGSFISPFSVASSHSRYKATNRSGASVDLQAHEGLQSSEEERESTGTDSKISGESYPKQQSSVSSLDKDEELPAPPPDWIQSNVDEEGAERQSDLPVEDLSQFSTECEEERVGDWDSNSLVCSSKDVPEEEGRRDPTVDSKSGTYLRSWGEGASSRHCRDVDQIVLIISSILEKKLMLQEGLRSWMDNQGGQTISWREKKGQREFSVGHPEKEAFQKRSSRRGIPEEGPLRHTEPSMAGATVERWVEEPSGAETNGQAYRQVGMRDPGTRQFEAERRESHHRSSPFADLTFRLSHSQKKSERVENEVAGDLRRRKSMRAVAREKERWKPHSQERGTERGAERAGSRKWSSNVRERRSFNKKGLALSKEEGTSSETQTSSSGERTPPHSRLGMSPPKECSAHRTEKGSVVRVRFEDQCFFPVQGRKEKKEKTIVLRSGHKETTLRTSHHSRHQGRHDGDPRTPVCDPAGPLSAKHFHFQEEKLHLRRRALRSSSESEEEKFA